MDRKLQLELRFAAGDNDETEPRAFRVEGGAREWLQELMAWDCPHRQVQVLPLPTSPSNRAPCAALMVAPTSVAAGPKCVPYHCRANRLYLPSEGSIWPPVTDAELHVLLQDRIYVWEPQSGLAAFEPSPWLRPDQLLQPPDSEGGAWLPAPEAVTLAPRVIALAALLPPDSDEAVQAGQEDIGQDTDKAGGLPRSEQESKPGAMGAASTKGKQLAAGAAKMAAGMLPGSWAERLGAWADQRRQEVDRTVEADQNREVERLMKIMEENPDEGLKYAPPLASDMAHRGETPGGGSLAPRDTNFSLGRLGGSGPAQSWSVSNANYFRLKSQYRNAANRELALKRYRRAAYIFAELLGDFRAAAGALTAGKHYRDAAALYAQKLNSPREAASCLERGGLLSEAIELYVELEQFEKAGDLYMQLDQPDAARRQYLAAVDKLNTSAQTQPLTIAKLQLEKLQEREAAMQTLWDAWPNGARAKECTAMWFRLAAEDQENLKQEMHRQIDRIAAVDSEHALLAAEVLSERALENDPWKAEVLRGLQHLVGSSLSELHPDARPRLLHLLQAATPGDRLLRRDARKHLRQSTTRATPARQGLELLKRLRLPTGANWQRVCRLQDTLLVAGELNQALVLLPIRWERASVKSMAICTPWLGMQIPPDGDILLSCCAQGDPRVVVQPVGQETLPLRSLQTQGKTHWVEVGATGGVSSRTMAVARLSGDITWSFNYHGEQCVLDLFRGSAPIQTHVVVPGELEWPEFTPRIACSGSNVFLSWGHELHVCGPEKEHAVHEFAPQAIRRLAASSTNEDRVAVGFELGGAMVLDDWGEQPFGEGVVEPEVCFQGEHLLVAGQKRLEIYAAGGQDLRLQTSWEDAELDPQDIVTGPGNGQFALLSGRDMYFFQR